MAENDKTEPSAANEAEAIKPGREKREKPEPSKTDAAKTPTGNPLAGPAAPPPSSPGGIRTTVSGPAIQQVHIPEILPILPVRGTVGFPGAVMPLTIGRDRGKRLLDQVLPGEKLVGVLTQKSDSPDDPQPTDLYAVGTVALVLKMIRLPEGQQNIVVHGLVRFRVVEMIGVEPFMRAKVEVLPDQNPVDSQSFGMLMQSVRAAAARMVDLSPNIPEEATTVLNNIDAPGTLADFLAANLNDSVADKQTVLEQTDVTRRLEMVRERIMSRIELLELQAKIQSQVRSNIDRNQRNYFLQEQMKAIQKELGVEDGQTGEITELRRRLDECKLPEAVKKETDRELQRLAAIPQASPEFGVIRSFLDTVAELPWSKSTQDDLNIKKARQILDRDHYDLEKIKNRIIEFLAVRRLNPSGRSPILCFAGPPGVGKTSLGRSIAESLGRKFVRMSLGGVRDEADIRGHRRTYIGAMPGRVIQELRKAGSNNPVMMLDEIDKLGADFRGDPSSALLEVLDPEQNNSFQDHYLGVAFDLSSVIFICTANYMEPVPAPLKDRMEVIEVPGYTQQDKLLIARRYLFPRQLKEHGIGEKQCRVPNKTISAIIDQYTREAGVRGLNRSLAGVVRGVAARIAEDLPPPDVEKPRDAKIAGKNGEAVPAAGAAKEPEIAEARPVETFKLSDIPTITVQPEDLPTYLGPPKFENELAQRVAMAGVVTGLAYTPFGGEILFVEATRMPGKGNLQLTGQIGDVMKESAQAAFSLLKNNAQRLAIDPKIFGESDVHVHVPAGAVPKDGPSAGVAMYTALASLFTGSTVRPDVAMTGEITLRGLVLPIGGVKEKVIGAHRAGIKTVLLPERNRKDLTEVREDVRKALKFEFAENVDQVLAIAFGKAKGQRAAIGPHLTNGSALVPAQPQVAGGRGRHFVPGPRNQTAKDAKTTTG